MVIAANIKALLNRTRSLLRGDRHRFLRHVTGVIHVGANTGQERDLYDAHHLDVVWVEPIPEVFQELEANIAALPRQRGIRCLVADVDGKEYTLHVANNHGQSSSIFQLKHHRDVWPEIRYEKAVPLTGLTLPSLLKLHGIDCRDYQALVLDTQGSELLILQGAGPVLPAFRYIKTEAADFEAYEGCCRLGDVSAFLADHGFREHSRRRFATRPQGGHYYDVLYERV